MFLKRDEKFISTYASIFQPDDTLHRVIDSSCTSLSMPHVEPTAASAELIRITEDPRHHSIRMSHAGTSKKYKRFTFFACSPRSRRTASAPPIHSRSFKFREPFLLSEAEVFTPG
jgi:hypothetical protein